MSKVNSLFQDEQERKAAEWLKANPGKSEEDAYFALNCDCGSVNDGPWAGIHSKNCATVLIKSTFRMHDMERGTIVRVGSDGHGRELCNTLNSSGDQQANARFIFDAIKAFQKVQL